MLQQMRAVAMSAFAMSGVQMVLHLVYFINSRIVTDYMSQFYARDWQAALS
jgi:heme/copper-type cytochrome/quinol oxidase subunit 4